MDDDDPKSNDFDSQKRFNLFVCHAKKASVGPQMMFGRALLIIWNCILE